MDSIVFVNSCFVGIDEEKRREEKRRSLRDMKSREKSRRTPRELLGQPQVILYFIRLADLLTRALPERYSPTVDAATPPPRTARAELRNLFNPFCQRGVLLSRCSTPSVPTSSIWLRSRRSEDQAVVFTEQDEDRACVLSNRLRGAVIVNPRHSQKIPNQKPINRGGAGCGSCCCRCQYFAASDSTVLGRKLPYKKVFLRYDT